MNCGRRAGYRRRCLRRCCMCSSRRLRSSRSARTCTSRRFAVTSRRWAASLRSLRASQKEACASEISPKAARSKLDILPALGLRPPLAREGRRFLRRAGVASAAAAKAQTGQRTTNAARVEVVYRDRVHTIEAAPVPATCASAAAWAAGQAKGLAGWSK
ncbi:hypothetical protein THICB2_730199 [Thiomonas sp. CB2]|nr:hypothetical protein THICB2_730199 [Thiomonas sp. CB2]VDY06916.1 protein of unknown function [Thiomonas sp. Bio17B3]VDY09788.1 protein of unknown function [Thiomonas sp. Sup16B3]VDY15190.1 conserved protein of unknown function [Thiomonas sp. OC7]VDY11023.1 protein of unknown function [Thiomonas sp. Sup16B3]